MSPETRYPSYMVFVVKQARIVRKVTGYFVILSLQVDVDVPQPLPHRHPKGLDLGFISAVVTSDNESIPRPRFLNKYAAREASVNII